MSWPAGLGRPLIAPSILSADPLRFLEEIRAAEDAGADFHHVDVMDGHYVPNLTFGLPLIKALKAKSRLPLDVHIMITNPNDTALAYVEAGADCLTFHIEAARHHHRLLDSLRKAGAKVGIAINPGTSLASASDLLDLVDLINVMGVNPGFSGQSFIAGTVAKVAELDRMLKERGTRSAVLIEVDGGVSDRNIASLSEAGADLFVAGNFVYGAADRAQAITALRSAARSGR